MSDTVEAVEAVVFDLDGVLVDSEVWWDDIRRDWAAEHGRRWTEADRAAVMGANGRQWSTTMARRLELDLPPAEIEGAIVGRVVARYRSEGPPRIDGAVDAVERAAREVPVAVASSAHRDVIDAALDGLGIADRFGAIVSSDEVEHGKPAPDVYLETARRLGVDPRGVVVVEDSLNGVRAAKAAGMRVVLVPNASIPPAPGAAELADVVLPSLAGFDPSVAALGA
ncbi:MAG TPA: HAD family phosphatase [Candidatus Limnocylindrales bacterium]|nr:HAD family phosphatase [Candidatus Limnocylindrales bacterium]